MTIGKNNNVLPFSRPNVLSGGVKRINDKACKVYILNGSTTVILLPEGRRSATPVPFQQHWQSRYAPTFGRGGGATVGLRGEHPKADIPEQNFPCAAFCDSELQLSSDDRRDIERAENEGMLVDYV